MKTMSYWKKVLNEINSKGSKNWNFSKKKKRKFIFQRRVICLSLPDIMHAYWIFEYLQLFNLEVEKESLDRIADYSFNHKSRCLGASLVKSFDLLGFHILIFIDPRLINAREERKPKKFNGHVNATNRPKSKQLFIFFHTFLFTWNTKTSIPTDDNLSISAR